MFDVGANIGLFSLYMNRLRPSLNLFAFEPLPPLYRLLQENWRHCGMLGHRGFWVATEQDACMLGSPVHMLYARCERD